MSTQPTELILRIDPNVTEIVGLDHANAIRLFGHQYIDFRANGRDGISHEPRTGNPYLQPLGGNLPTIPTARLDEYERILRAEGYLTQRENCCRNFECLDLTWFGRRAEWEQEFARVLSANLVGRVAIMNNRQRINAIKLIFHLFSATNIVVVVSSQKEAVKYEKMVKGYLPERVAKSYSDLSGYTRFVFICCEPTFIKIDPGYFTVVVFPDLVKALANKIVQDTIPLREHRIYAIEDSRVKLDRDQAWKAEYLAGARIVNLVSKDRCSAAAFVVRRPRVANAITGNAFEVKRQSIWENQGRNLYIARLAESLVRGEGPGEIN